MAADLTTGAPPEIAAPPTADALRTERADWIFVHYLRTWNLQPGGDPTEIRVANAADLPRAVAALLARDESASPFPLVWLAAELGPAFEEAYLTPALARAKRRDGGDPAAWDAALPDMTPVFEAVQAQEDAAARDDPREPELWAAVKTTWERIVPDPAVRDFLKDQDWSRLEEFEALTRHWSGRPASAFLADSIREEAHWRLHPFERWRVILQHPHNGQWTTSRGAEVPDPVAHAETIRRAEQAEARARGELPVHLDAARKAYGRLKRELRRPPTTEEWAGELEKEGIKSPTKAVAPVGPVPEKATRQTARRVAAKVEEVALGVAAERVFKSYRAKGINPSRAAISKAMRAAGAKGQDKVLVDAYRSKEADPLL